MKKIILTMLLFLSSFAFSANEPMPIDLSVTMDQIMGCITKYEDGRYLPCEKSESTQTSVFRIVFENSHQVPDIFRQYVVSINGIEQTNSARVSVLVLIENDNLEVLGLTRVFDSEPGDDYGMTHRTLVAISKIVDSKNIEYSYQSTLYTSPIKGRYQDPKGNLHRSQFFENETILKAIVDNIPQGNVQFWRAEVGFISLSSNSTANIMDASSQQASLHSIINAIKPGTMTEFNNVSDGAKDRWGVFVGAFLGLQKKFRLSERTQLRLQGDVGSRLSTLSNSSYAQASVGANVSYNLQEAGRITLGLDVNYKRHSSGNESKKTMGLAYETVGGSTLGFAVSKTSGVLMTNSKYNNYNVITGRPDATWYFYFKKPIH